MEDTTQDAAETTDATNAENAATLLVIADVEADVEADPHHDAADPREEEALEVAADLQEEKAAAAEAEADPPLARDRQEDRAVPQERLAEAVAEAVLPEELAALQLDLVLLAETTALVSVKDLSAQLITATNLLPTENKFNSQPTPYLKK